MSRIILCRLLGHVWRSPYRIRQDKVVVEVCDRCGEQRRIEQAETGRTWDFRDSKRGRDAS
jgi:RNase P subunit RPR2